MINYKFSPQEIALISGSSSGTQKKCFRDGYWYKVNQNGYEGTAEYLVSTVLSFSNLTNFAAYEQCSIIFLLSGCIV